MDKLTNLTMELMDQLAESDEKIVRAVIVLELEGSFLIHSQEETWIERALVEEAQRCVYQQVSDE